MDSAEDVVAALGGAEPVLVFVYGPAWPDMPEAWDAARDAYRGDVRMMKTHTTYDINMAYGVHRFPTFLSNRGPKEFGARNVEGVMKMLLQLE